MDYNYLDLPDKFTFAGGTITNPYTANGQKLKSVTNDNGDISEHYYEDGFEYEDGKLVSIFHEEGRIVYNGRQLEDDMGLGCFVRRSLAELENDYGARWYDASVGRFTTVDPLAEVGGQESWSSYHYVVNNPLRYIDPFGLKAEDTYGASNNGAIKNIDDIKYYKRMEKKQICWLRKKGKEK